LELHTNEVGDRILCCLTQLVEVSAAPRRFGPGGGRRVSGGETGFDKVRLARSNRLAGGLLRRVFFFAARLGLSRGGSAREAHEDSERAAEAEREAKLAHFSVHPDSSIEAPPSQIATHGRVGKIRLPQLLSAPCEWNDPFPPIIKDADVSAAICASVRINAESPA
jgi:hypothetical protein